MHACRALYNKLYLHSTLLVHAQQTLVLHWVQCDPSSADLFSLQTSARVISHIAPFIASLPRLSHCPILRDIPQYEVFDGT